jgi:hypothetical protein
VIYAGQIALDLEERAIAIPTIALLGTPVNELQLVPSGIRAGAVKITPKVATSMSRRKELTPELSNGANL